MKTIVIASQKGGSAKTTLAAHLAVQAERSGDSPAWLIDTDKQATLTMWHDRREAETPGLFEVALPRLPQALMQLDTDGAAYCFIDTPPSISEQSAAAVARFIERTCGRIGRRSRASQPSATASGTPALSLPNSRTSSAW